MRILVLAACALAGCGQEPSTDDAPASPPPPNWESRLADMLPYIDACIAQTPETRWVSYAGPTGEEQVIVRLLGDGGGYDCTAPLADPSRALIAPRQEDLEIPGERSAIFVRGPGENPGGECYQAEEVHAADGALLGWWADPDGC